MFGADQPVAEPQITKCQSPAGLLQSYRDEYTRHGQRSIKSFTRQSAGGLRLWKTNHWAYPESRSFPDHRRSPLCRAQAQTRPECRRGPGNDAIACTALAAAGAQIILFTTGRERRWRTGPTMKIASTDQLAQLKPHGSIFHRLDSRQERADPEWSRDEPQMIDVTNGRKAQMNRMVYREISLLKHV
jgi:hypothetical protein